MSGGCVGTSGLSGMLVSAGHSGIIGAGVASWQSHFKVVSGGHAGASGAWGDRSRDASGVTHRGMVSGATLGRNEQETMDSERYNGFRGAMGDRDPKVWSVGNTLG